MRHGQTDRDKKHLDFTGQKPKKDQRTERNLTEHDSLGSESHEVIPVIAHRNKDQKSPFESVITIVSIPSNNKKVTKSNNKERGSINIRRFSFRRENKIFDFESSY